MKRTRIDLEPELEVLLKLEVLRQKRPMMDLVREALYAYPHPWTRQSAARRRRVRQWANRHRRSPRRHPHGERLWDDASRTPYGTQDEAMSVWLGTVPLASVLSLELVP